MIKPVYYDRFACIADKCSFNCCKEWKISVDDATAKKWQRAESPDGGKLKKYITFRDGERIVCLQKNGDCPFQNEEGLCKIVIAHGEEMLSETCQMFPREKKEFADRTEWNLMSTCPEVLDIIKKEGFGVQECGWDDTIPAGDSKAAYEIKLYQLRKLLLQVAKMNNLGVKDALRTAFRVVKDCLDKEISDKDANADWEVPSLKALFASGDTSGEYKLDRFAKLESFVEKNELLLDITENYRKQGMYKRFLDDICSTAEDYEARMDEDSDCYDEGVFEEVSEYIFNYEAYMKKEYYFDFFMELLAEELYADILRPDCDLTYVLMRIEWIALKMAVIDQMLLIDFINRGADLALGYENIRDIVITVMRMTGYNDEDIEEYMEDCFTSVIWDFPYIRLITE